MKRLLTSTLFAGLCLGLVLPGCVSSRKYKESQSSLNMTRQTVEQLRADSARLATEATTMNQKISTLESERTSMKSSLDSLNTYISQQRPNMDYQTYFSGQEQSGTQMQQSLTSSLAAVGLSSEDIQHQYGTVVVSIDEAKHFSGANLNASGKKVMKEIATAIKGQSDYKVGVTPMSPFGGSDSASMAMNDESSTESSSSSSSSGSENGTTASGVTSSRGTGSRVNSNVPDNTRNTSSARSTTAARKSSTARKTTTKRYSSESGRTVSNRIKPRKSTATPMSIRTQRATNVAKSLLQNGVDEVNVTLKNTKSSTGGTKQKESIRVVLSPDNNKMYNQRSTAEANRTTSGQE
jgi:outer membrane murein-binding lipoprotein Lpp